MSPPPEQVPRSAAAGNAPPPNMPPAEPEPALALAPSPEQPEQPEQPERFEPAPQPESATPTVPAPSVSGPPLEPEPQQPLQPQQQSHTQADTHKGAYREVGQMNSCGSGVVVGLLLVAISQLFNMDYLVSRPAAAAAYALSWTLWLFLNCFIFIMVAAIGVYSIGLHENYVADTINSALYSVDQNGRPTGILSSRLTAKNVEIMLFRCRITILDLEINPKQLDDAVLDPFLNWSPLRTRKIQLDRAELRWSLLRAPRLTLVVGGLHIATFGQWNDDACLVRSFRLARTGLWGWVDQVYNHDRDRVVRPVDASVMRPTVVQAPVSALRSFCNKTGAVLKPGGHGDERWFHKPGTAYDVCGKVYSVLPVEEQARFVEVRDAENLGSEANNFAYRVAGGKQSHAEWSASQSKAEPPVASSSWLMAKVVNTLQLIMTDFRFSYTQLSATDCPLGMFSEYIPAQQRSSTNSSNIPNCQLHGFLIRVGKLALGPNVPHIVHDQADEWERAWSQLAPRGETHFQPSPERLRFDEWELENFAVPYKDLNMEHLSRIGKQLGVLENFSFHLLGGAPSDNDNVPSHEDYVPHIERTTGPFYDDETEDRNTRAPMVLLSSEFEFYRTGVGLSPIGEIGRINCPRSKLRVKLSTQDASILAPIAARFLAYKSNADAALSYGTISLRPAMPGFARVKQHLSAPERWKWAFFAIRHARREERREMSWELLRHRCDVRKRYVAIWKRYIYLDLNILHVHRDDPDKKADKQERIAVRNDAKELENGLEWDQCIMYRRIAWMHVMTEIECALDPPYTLAHGRNRMLQLVENSNQWVFDFGYMCPHACHYANVDYELCVADEKLADTKTVEEFQRALAANDKQGIDFTDGAGSLLSIRLQIASEARLPEVRFRASHGEVHLRRFGATHKLATLSTLDRRHAFACGAWLVGSQFADSGDPISFVLYLSDVHVVHDPSLGNFLGGVAASCAPLGALGARLPPYAADPPDRGASGLPAAKVPSLAGGNVEADQLASHAKHGVIVVVADQIRIDLPVRERSEDCIQLRLQQVGVKVGLPHDAADASQWCCDEHRDFGHWPSRQLYKRTHVYINEFAASVKYLGQLESMLEPGQVNIIIDDCLLPQQWRLPNTKANVYISQIALKFSPRTLKAALRCITHLHDQQEHAAKTASAIKLAQSATERMAPANSPQQDDESAVSASDTQSDDDDESVTQHRGDKIMHPTCFCLVELSNYTQYTLTLEHWTSRTGQVLSDISSTVKPASRIHWASAQRGKLKGNEGCAVFSIHDDTGNVHVEVLLMWSIPWVGEDTAAVAIGKPREFTFMAEMSIAKQRRELIKLMRRYTNLLHNHNGIYRAALGDIQVSSSFGCAPCKFGVFHRRSPESIHKLLREPDDPRAVKRYRRHMTCHLANKTNLYLQAKKIVFGVMEGQCIKAIDPIVPPQHEAVWTSAATRKLRGNAGCAIFSVGGVAELLIQWFVPNIGTRMIYCVLSHDGAFSCIPDSKLQKQVEEGPDMKTSATTDFTHFEGLRASHQMLDKKTATFTLSSTNEAIDDGRPLIDLLSIEDIHSEAVKLWDYKRLALTCTVAKLSTSIVGQDCVREVTFKVDDIGLHMHQSDLQSDVNIDLGALEVADTFYSGEDMYLITSNAYGSADDFCTVGYRTETSSNEYAHHGPLSTKVSIKTSPLIAKYTFNTIFFLLSLKNDAAQQSIFPAEHTEYTSCQPAQSGDQVEFSGIVAKNQAAGEQATGNTMTPILDVDLRTGEISVSICDSKLTPLVQLMVNKIDSTYKSCGQRAHAVFHVDFGIFYHNMQLSAWEPLLEWTAVQLDTQKNEVKSTTTAVSDGPFNLNITSELLVSLIWLQADKAAYYDDDETNDPTEDCTLYVVNEVGVPLDFNIMNEQSRVTENARRRNLLNLWAAVDSDQNGTLDRDEVWQVLSRMGKHLSEEEFDRMMTEIDTDGDGEINFAEFLEWFQTMAQISSPGGHVGHGGWTATPTSGKAIGVPRDQVHMPSPQTFDPAALGNRGELSTNYVLLRIGSPQSMAGNAWRPLKPQSLSATGCSLHHLRPTQELEPHSERVQRSPLHAFVCVKIAHRNSATYVSVQSPVLVSNQLSVDLLMELVDDANFEREDLTLQRQSYVPVPVHLLGRRVRFKQIDNVKNFGEQQMPSRWTEFVRPGDGQSDHIVLTTSESCCAYPLFMDTGRGPETCTVVLHRPLKFENTLPCAVKITLSKHHMGKSRRKGLPSPSFCAGLTKEQDGSDLNSDSVSFEQFVLQKGETFVPSCVDVRYPMTIFVELQGSPANQLSKLKQKAPAAVWPTHSADKKLEFLDESKTQLNLQLAYESQQGSPTIVTIYATHWVVNETQLELHYFDTTTKGSARIPANHEGRQWLTPEPFLWCFHKGQGANNKMSIGLDGRPEGSFAPNHPELCTTLEIKSQATVSHSRFSSKKEIGRRKHRILCYVTNGPDRFLRTKVVYLRHELLFRNQTPHTVVLRCAEGDVPPICVLPEETCPFSWPANDALYKALKIYYDLDDLYGSSSSPPEDLLQWTAEFEIGAPSSDGFKVHIGELFLKVPHTRDNYKFSSLRIEVTNNSTTRQNTVVVTEHEAPYRIENYLGVKIGFRQFGTAHLDADNGNWQELKPNHFAPFNWDLPLSRSLAGRQQLLEVLVGTETCFYDINAVGHSSEDQSNTVCVGEVVVEGHTRILKIHKRIEDLPCHVTFDRADQLDNQVFELRLHSLGMSVVDNASSSTKELVYILVDGIHIHTGSSSTQSATEVQIADIQIADQSVSDDSKCVKFGRHHAKINSGAKVGSDTINGTRDHFHLAIIGDLRNSSDICDAYSFVALGVVPSVLKFDDDFILKLWNYKQRVSDKLEDTFPETYGPDAETAAAATAAAGARDNDLQEDVSVPRKIYIRRLEIHPIMIEVAVNIDGSLFDGEGLGLPGFLQTLGVAFGNIASANLSLDELREDDVFQDADDFGNHVMSFYWGQLVVAGFRVLGASAFLGNPIALFGNVVEGVGDFLYMPARGLVTSPTDMVKGLSKGTESLVTHTLTGALSSVGTMTGALGKGLDKLSDSESHAARLKTLREKHGTGIVAGLTVGTESLAFGLMDGISGIVLQPLHGLRTHGLPGLLQGVERGIVGAVAQPAAGALQLVSEVTTGATQTKILGYKVGDELKRARIPRPFFHGSLLTPYSQEWAAECAHMTEIQMKPKPATLKITLHAVLFPETAAGTSVWPWPLRAAITIGPSASAHPDKDNDSDKDTLAEGVADVCADPQTGFAVWDKNGTGHHQFEDISVELENNALPASYEVLSITIMSSDRSSNKGSAGIVEVDRPVAQFDVLLSGLGLDDAWRREASYERAANMAGSTSVPEAAHVDSCLSIRAAFDQMDKHGDGRINRAELITALKSDETIRSILNLPARVGDNERRSIEERFQELDSDGSRHFGWPEFEQYVKAHCSSLISACLADNSHGCGDSPHAHKQVRLRKGASWECDGLHTASRSSPHVESSIGSALQGQNQRPSPSPRRLDEAGRIASVVLGSENRNPVAGETETDAEEQERNLWIRPKIGEGCWVDVELQLVDELGQLSHNASVRMRSENRRYSKSVKRTTDLQVKNQRHHRLSLLSPTVDRAKN